MPASHWRDTKTQSSSGHRKDGTGYDDSVSMMPAFSSGAVETAMVRMRIKWGMGIAMDMGMAMGMAVNMYMGMGLEMIFLHTMSVRVWDITLDVLFPFKSSICLAPSFITGNRAIMARLLRAFFARLTQEETI